MKQHNKEDKLYRLYILLGIVILLWFFSIPVIHWISSLSFVNWPSNQEAATGRGTFGDSFGAINSLFSGMALAGIIYTIFLQKKELALQREELKETREEFKIQNKTLRLQRFENTFFNLLSLHHQIVDGIDIDIDKIKKKPNRRQQTTVIVGREEEDVTEYENNTLKGRDVFKYEYEYLVDHFNKTRGDDLNPSYSSYYEIVQTDFGHYFRNLYRMIKLVDETEFISNQEFNEDEQKTYESENHKIKYKYTSIIRSQLSNYELLWLFYNCLSSYGNDKFKPLVEKYSLLKNIPPYLHNSNDVDLYSTSAFEKTT